MRQLLPLLLLTALISCKTTQQQFDKATKLYGPKQATVRLAELYPEYYEKPHTDTVVVKINDTLRVEVPIIDHDTIIETTCATFEYHDGSIDILLLDGHLAYTIKKRSVATVYKATKQAICPPCPPCPNEVVIQEAFTQHRVEVAELEQMALKYKEQRNGVGLLLFLLIAIYVGYRIVMQVANRV